MQTTTNTTADNKLTETDSLSNQVIHMYCMDLCNVVICSHFQDHVYEQPYCLQGQSSSPMDVVQVGAGLPIAPEAILTSFEKKMCLQENVAYGQVGIDP